MTGKGKKNNIRRCPLCEGTMEEGIATLPFLIAEKVIVVKNVPAEICSNCGEPYMKSQVVSAIEELLDRLDDLQSEVSIVYYKAA
ncbi:MAG TPA: type II toxin-antitoxin system MqsA family antitoxin [Syntrophales bacterium]|nr:type II toxin-antitoxin system MqsA family antitoxin [Syntrophales bacterium]